jgi:hypothetical protein
MKTITPTIAKITLTATLLLAVLACEQPSSASAGATPGGNGCASPTDTGTFVESGGLVIVEAESVPTAGDWDQGTATDGYTGSSYLEWTGPDLFSKPGEGLLSYQLEISTPGTYRFRWRSRINVGTNNTEHNDAWLRFPDADDFYGQKNSSIVYPKGSGKSPNPNGAGKDGWFKVYQNTRDKWSWDARTSDHDAHNIYVRFDNPGTYTMEISGRSFGFALDRIVLFTDSVSNNDATDEDAGQSQLICE